MAHSAGAIYALATALRMPQHIRGRIHLLATWIPPSQISNIGSHAGGSAPTASMPTSQRILRALPTPILRAANTSFMSATSSSLTSSLPKSPRRKKNSGTSKVDTSVPTGRDTPTLVSAKRDSNLYPTASGKYETNFGSDTNATPNQAGPNGFGNSNSHGDLSYSSQGLSASRGTIDAAALMLAEKERQTTFDMRLTQAIWSLATRGANPAVDLLVCLERRQPIGFRYVDISRSVVMHHGAKDTRVPVENVKWLGRAMRRCEVRVLPGEGHGLMASAVVMGGVLMEIAKEWDDWTKVVEGLGSGSSRDLRDDANDRSRRTMAVGGD
jgi:pimeloyl-ACP methyl ester carboxylesterase